jgi:hypothetical protein
VIKNSIAYLNKRVASLFPDDSQEFVNIYDHALSRVTESLSFNESLTFSIAKYKSLSSRSLEDVRSFGFCLDNIVPKPSTVPFAGNGAFAVRFIPQGAVVVPVPLLHMVKGGNFAYNKLSYDKNGTLTRDTSLRHSQLLLNYCFGHQQSTLIMCPTTNAILINHKTTPNAILRWADWDETTVRWKNLSLKEIDREEGRGLSLEIVALRDIAAGEEVRHTISYFH